MKADLKCARQFIKVFDLENMTNRKVEWELKKLKITHEEHMCICKIEKSEMKTKLNYLINENARLTDELEKERAIKLEANVELLRKKL